MSDTFYLDDYNTETYQNDPDLPKLGEFIEADPEDAQRIIDAPVDADGRSEWLWIRLRNGDLIMGCFPAGETYFEYEEKYP